MNTIRDDFPFLKGGASAFAYLDNAATTQKPQQVLTALDTFYKDGIAAVHRGIYARAEEATQQYERARAIVARFIGAEPAEIIFTAGATSGLNIVAAGMREYLKPGDEIVLTQLEHHANLVPWQELARATGATLNYIPVAPDGQLVMASVEQCITPRTKIVACTAQSNVVGMRVDLVPLVERAHAVGAFIVVDAVQLVPHTKVAVQALGADALVFSGHKILGPYGIGVLYMRRALQEQLRPLLFGGGMVHDVDFCRARYCTGPAKFEAGTPPVAEAIGLAAGLQYIEERVDFARLQKMEAAWCRQLITGLAQLPGFRVLGNEEALAEHGHLVSFVHETIHAHDIAAYLDTYDIAVRAGNHCAQPLCRVLGVDACVRVSFYLYNTESECERVLFALKKMIAR